MEAPEPQNGINLPRVAITYCTQCRWMLRAAYFGQELLSTFGLTIGEIALIPATGGLFQVHVTYSDLDEDTDGMPIRKETKTVLLWDRKTEGGFPETRVLKQLLRDHIDPSKQLGHSDKAGKTTQQVSREVVQNLPTSEPENTATTIPHTPTEKKTQECKDCE